MAVGVVDAARGDGHRFLGFNWSLKLVEVGMKSAKYIEDGQEVTSRIPRCDQTDSRLCARLVVAKGPSRASCETDPACATRVAKAVGPFE